VARIELVNLRKTYGPVVAVRDLSCTIEDGEFVVFVGPSGCGKTTTLRLIAGFEEPDRGEIRIDGRVVNDLEPLSWCAYGQRYDRNLREAIAGHGGTR